MKKSKMMVAGPVNVTDSVKKSLVYDEIGHREPEFEKIYSSVADQLLKAFSVDSSKYTPFVIGGSGTAAIESAITANIHSGRKMLVVNNGAFGDRMVDICSTYKIPRVRTNNQWGEYPNLSKIEKLLISKPKIEAVSMTLLETSTGMVNPVDEVGKLCKKYNKLFIVDAVSGFAGDPLDVGSSHIDFCISNTNKGLSGLPVISFGIAKNKTLDKIKDIQPRNYYLNLLKHIKYGGKNQTPFTPQIPLFRMLDQSLTELLEEGVENRIERYAENSRLMRQRLSQMGFALQLHDHMSNVMTNVLLPKNYAYLDIHSRLKDKGYIVYPGKGHLEGKVIHIANVGTTTTKEVDEFCNVLSQIITERPKY